MSGPTVCRINRMSSTVAPPPENPVDVLTKSAFASFANLQARTFSSSVNKAVSIITFVSASRSEEHTSELQSRGHLVCRLLLEKNNNLLSTFNRNCLVKPNDSQ